MHTIDSNVVRFDESLLDFSILHHECVPLASLVSEDRCAVEKDVEGFGELAGGIAQETNLY